MMGSRFFRIVGALAIVTGIATQALAYGPDGHHIVGAIADARLTNTAAGKKIAVMLDGMTLREAAQVPDTIKGWDSKGVDDPKNARYFSSRPRIAAQLREFWKANQPTHDRNSSTPSHHWFHYTDVPIEAAKYSAGKTGRTEWDIVHMSAYCIGVLRGEISEDNPRKITKAIAIILLAHYLGDIHQPLHVGAEYFDQTGHPLNPDLGKPALEDQGGNSIMLELPGSSKPTKLHSFWDSDPVKALFPGGVADPQKDERKAEMGAAEKGIVADFANEEPKNWRMPPSLPLKDYPEAWANEILPLARDAYARLVFQGMTAKTQDDGTMYAGGNAHEKPMPDHLSYRAWSGMIVREELHKAGWRLADLLEKCVAPGGGNLAAPVAPTPIPATAVVQPTPPIVANANDSLGANNHASPYGAYPDNYKEIVRTWLRSNMPDPASVMIQWQTEPKPADLPDGPGRKVYGYLVVFGTASKNSVGVVGAVQTRSALIHDGEVVKTGGF